MAVELSTRDECAVLVLNRPEALNALSFDIIRRIGQDREVFARVDLDKVFAGLQPDIYLKPNDIVRVGTNALQPFIASFRNAFRITYGFGFLYDRNYAPDNNNNNGAGGHRPLGGNNNAF